MPAIEVDSGQKKAVDDVMKFVRIAFEGNENLSLEARVIFVMEVNRYFKKEIDEWKAKATRTASEEGR